MHGVAWRVAVVLLRQHLLLWLVTVVVFGGDHGGTIFCNKLTTTVRMLWSMFIICSPHPTGTEISSWLLHSPTETQKHHTSCSLQSLQAPAVMQHTSGYSWAALPTLNTCVCDIASHEHTPRSGSYHSCVQSSLTRQHMILVHEQSSGMTEKQHIDAPQPPV